MDVVPASRRTAKKAVKSSSETRTIPSIECTGRAPDLIQRRTVRVETLSASATWVIVRKRSEAAEIVAFLAGIGHATPRRRSSDGTLINLRAPIFVHSISPLFILL